MPYLYTSDGRTIRYPDPIIRVHDSIQLDISSGKIQDNIKFDSGNLCMVTGGRNTGRVGTIMSRLAYPFHHLKLFSQKLGLNWKLVALWINII